MSVELPVQRPAQAPDIEGEDFQPFVDHFVAAFSSGDIGRIGPFLHRNERLIYVAEEFADPFIGWDAVMDYWRANAAAMTRMAMRAGAVQANLLGPDVVGLLYPLHWEAQFGTHCLGGDVLASPIVRRIDGVWVIVHYTECALGAMPFIRSVYKKAVSAEFLAGV